MNDVPIIKPTKERMRRMEGYDELTEAQPGGVPKKTGAVRDWGPLENLYRNGGLTQEQYRAGVQLYADCFRGGLAGSRVTMRWEEYISGLGAPGNLDGVERRVFFRNRYFDACTLLRKSFYYDEVHAFCVEDIKAEDIGKRFYKLKTRQTASASATRVIAKGLQLLAKFYGFVK